MGGPEGLPVGAVRFFNSSSLDAPLSCDQIGRPIYSSIPIPPKPSPAPGPSLGCVVIELPPERFRKKAPGNNEPLRVRCFPRFAPQCCFATVALRPARFPALRPKRRRSFPPAERRSYSRTLALEC